MLHRVTSTLLCESAADELDDLSTVKINSARGTLSTNHREHVTIFVKSGFFSKMATCSVSERLWIGLGLKGSVNIWRTL